MLTHLQLRGYKSIKDLDLELRPLNVLIGANGAGKSNLLSFFDMLQAMLLPPGELQYYVAKRGGASVFLHDGPKVTPELSAAFTVTGNDGSVRYQFRLAHAVSDSLIFAQESVDGQYQGKPVGPCDYGAGHLESKFGALPAGYSQDHSNLMFLFGMSYVARMPVVYHFEDTSATSRMRSKWDVEDSHALKADGGNLAPFLWRLYNDQRPYYDRIVAAIDLVAPFFADFVFAPHGGTLLLQWRERGSDRVFGAHQASDGTLRAMALIALLLQPESDLPGLIVLDEPELGLHPAALDAIGGMIRAAALHTQVIVATQSVAFVDQCELEDLIVVDRPGRESQFHRPEEPEKLREWLDDYSLGELWNMNFLGGRPA